MTTNHTPGPWRQTGVNVRAGDALICYATNHHANTETPESEKLANARLIASAPDLLSALQRLVLEVESICAHEAGPTRDMLIERLHKDWDGKILDSRHAISKAKGSQ